MPNRDLERRVFSHILKQQAELHPELNEHVAAKRQEEGLVIKTMRQYKKTVTHDVIGRRSALAKVIRTEPEIIEAAVAHKLNTNHDGSIDLTFLGDALMYLELGQLPDEYRNFILPVVIRVLEMNDSQFDTPTKE